MKQVEIDGLKKLAKSMSIKDLEFQIENAKKLRVPPGIFKDELWARQQAADVLDIPIDLKRDKKTNVSPAMLKGEPKLGVATVIEKKKRFEKPVSMTDEEYDAALAKFAAPKATKADADAPKKEKKIRVPRAEAPAGTFKLAEWAKGVKLDPRHVRRVARSIKGELSKLYVNGMKYVFKDADKPAVANLIHDGLANETKKTIKVKAKTPASKIVIPPPSETVWSGKAKKAKSPAHIVSAKEYARKEGKKAVRSFGKKNITKGK